MISHVDVKFRQLIVLNRLTCEYHLNMQGGMLTIKDETNNVLTKIGKNQVIAIIIIGNFTLTSPVLTFCQKNQINLVICHSNFRPIMCYGNMAYGNYVCRSKQHLISPQNQLILASQLTIVKINSSLYAIQNKRHKTEYDKMFIEKTAKNLLVLEKKITFITTNLPIDNFRQQLGEIMGIEGNVAKQYFKCMFDNLSWAGRKPRSKQDWINVIMDIGYTILFNYIEINLNFFGFDLFIGNLHQNFHQRKSLVCDLVEPFRFIIDAQIVKSINLNQFQFDHFEQKNNQYHFKKDYQKNYYDVFLIAILEYKVNIFINIQKYYRYFMKEDYFIALNLEITKDMDSQ